MTIYDYNYPEKTESSNTSKLLGIGIAISLFSFVGYLTFSQGAREEKIISPLPDNYEVPKPTSTLPVPLEHPTPQTIINEATHSGIIKKIYILESSEGKNDGCKKKGLVNGFGYGQNSRVWNCFESFEIVVSKLDQWLERELKTKTLGQALCWYNVGKVTEDCKYHRDFKSL